jgi:hypothetical protein
MDAVFAQRLYCPFELGRVNLVVRVRIGNQEKPLDYFWKYTGRLVLVAVV